MTATHDNRAANATAQVVSHPAVTRQSPARLLQHLWERWQSFAEARVRQLLLDIDDDLFARADALDSSVTQEVYFDAIGLLRYHSDDISSRFTRDITASVRTARQTDDRHCEDHTAANPDSRHEELSLIDEDVLEQRIAVAAMTQRFERNHTLEVLLAKRRIEALRGQLEPGSAAAGITMDARSLAEAFASSLGPLELDLRIRLILFKHFENEVMEPLAALFREFNETLVRAGILPKLDLANDASNKAIRKPQEPSTAAPRPAAAQPSATAAPTPLPSEHRPAKAAPTSGGTEEWFPRPLLPPGFDLQSAIKQRSALMRKLPALRQQRRFDQSTDPGQLLDVATVLKLLEFSERVAMSSWRHSDLERLPERLDFGAFLVEEARRGGRSQAGLRGADEDTLNLLQMLFDLILNDDHLAIPMRVMIARLQLPLLRVALVDASFFSSSRHPARRFLNAISHAGIGWGQAEEKSRDRLYAGIEQLVQRAGSEFAGDTTLFETLREDLDGLLLSEAERIKLAESRVIAQEQARIAAERTRRIVTRLIQHRMASAPPLPAPLENFLRTDWQQVLMRAHGSSESWHSAFNALHQLTGNGSARAGSALLEAVASGLSLLSMTSAAASRTAAEMVALWTEAVQKSGAARHEAASQPPQEDTHIELAELTEAATNEAETIADDATPSPEAIAAAQALEEQTWVELRTRSDKLMRCRLASVTEPPERYIFLNRRGLRIETLSRLQLAQAIEQGRLRVLDDRQLFDRALEQVIDGLRSAAATA